MTSVMGHRQAIPNGWEHLPLGKFGYTYGGLTGKRKRDFGHGSSKYVSFLGIINNLVIDDTKFERVDVDSSENQNTVKRGDILFTGSSETRNEVALCSFVDVERPMLYLNSFCFGFRISKPDMLDGFFLTYLVRSSIGRQAIASLSQGSTRFNISKRALLETSLPFPPIQEQRAIVTVLSELDALLDRLHRLITKKRDIKQATMQQLLTGRTRLPGFTDPWDTKRLGDHVRFLRNGTNSHSELLSSGHTKYIHYGNVHASRHSYVSIDSLAFLPESKTASLERLQEGDLIFVDASEDISGVGKSVELQSIEGINIVAGLHTIAARFSREVLANGFKRYLQFCPAFLQTIRRLAAGTKVLSTSRKHIEEVRMPLPPTSEQVAIATVLSDMDAEIFALEARRDKTQDLKRAMMQELLTGRTRLVNLEASDV